MNAHKEGWFSELSTMWPGQAFTLEVDEVLFDERSEYQHIQVLKTKEFGNALVLDGVIQATERDEFSYQEMLAHVPLFSHEKPERVLVIGGGDGGILREIGRHSCVKEMVICELDKMVIETSKRFMPSMACGFDDERLTLHIGDGSEFMKKHKNYFDVIIVDSSDPIGPAEALFERPFYATMNDALRANGIVCTQAECMWLHHELIGEMVRFSRTLFKHVDYATLSIPSYPCGSIGILACSNGASCLKPQRKCDAIQAQLRYYSSAIHEASFVLPPFVERALQQQDEKKEDNKRAIVNDAVKRVKE